MWRLEITRRGAWYLVLSMAVGIVALLSGNNILVLLESTLLSGLVLSILLARRTVSRVQLRCIRLPSSAGSVARDRVVFRNFAARTSFCIEAGEWNGRRFITLGYALKLGPREEWAIPSSQHFMRRGTHAWDGLAVASSFPFGLLRWIRREAESGERVIWPAAREPEERPSRGKGRSQAIQPARRLAEEEFSEGEVRPLAPDDDCRSIVWTLSARGGDPVVRPRLGGRAERESPEVTLDLRIEPGEEFETQVIRAAEPFHLQEEGSPGGTLTLIDHRGHRKLHGRSQALCQLALVQAAGRRLV